MAGRMRLSAALVALAVFGAACSSANGEVELAGVTVSTTETTLAATTTSPPTTEATATTLSDRAIAEAEIEQLVTDYWLSPFDTSQGQNNLEYLTGLIALRAEEFAQQVSDEGHIVRNLGQETIEVIGIEVDLEVGEGEVKACMGESGVRLDAETLEQVAEPLDPDYLTTTVLYVRETPDGWRISEMFPSNQTSEPEICELKAQ